MKSIIAGLMFAIIAVAFSMSYGLLIAGFVSITWGWFVVPLGVPPINFAHAFGIIIMLGLMRITKGGEINNIEQFHVIVIRDVLMFVMAVITFVLFM